MARRSVIDCCTKGTSDDAPSTSRVVNITEPFTQTQMGVHESAALDFQNYFLADVLLDLRVPRFSKLKDYHVIEKLYYERTGTFQPSSWKHYDPDNFETVAAGFARATTGKIDLVIHKESRYLGVHKKMNSHHETDSMTEFNILNICRDSPFIIKVIDGFQNDEFSVIMTEYAPFLTLDHLTQRMKGIAYNDARLYGLELLMALEYLHDRNIIHRDIKPENVYILLSGHIALGDLGSALQLQDEETAHGLCATYVTRPPEVWKGLRYGSAVDMWCFGITLYNIISNTWPFLSPVKKKQMEKVNKDSPRFDYKFNDESIRLIEWLLQKDPSKRPTCKEIMLHSYFFSLVEPYKPPYSTEALMEAYSNVSEYEIIKELLVCDGIKQSLSTELE
ncbi:putative serine/threonine-protein kinase PRKY isoform X2 [Physella acuta]|uniref:putative serine/threonine-protein kinase PRKY isoform X2 n=1 Tax=Physella acuta TaxID=109671 RepID=UPI0027DC0486|nr:putative serine/threonine-protein kinase PRKY isoform X2 [Physella acuta]